MSFLFWFVSALDVVALTAAFYRAPLKILVSERGLQHLFLGSVVVMTFLWSLTAGVKSGLEIHFLAMTAISLVMGWDIAIIAGLVVTLITLVLGGQSWMFLPLTVLAKVVVPALFTRTMLVLIEWKLPRNFFIYLFLAVFITGGLAGVLSLLTTGCYLAFTDTYNWETIVEHYFIYLPLIVFPEGFINGTLMIGMLVYLPDWVRTFDSKRYIDQG